MDFGLQGKAVIITGTGSQIGYGKAIALTLAEEGCRVVSTDIDFDGAKKTAEEIEAKTIDKENIELTCPECGLVHREQIKSVCPEFAKECHL